MSWTDAELPEDWAEPDEHSDWPDAVYIEHERFIASREPFTFHDERDRAMAASFYGDHQDVRHYAEGERHRRENDAAVWAGRDSAILTHSELEGIRFLDALSDCREHDHEDDDHVDDQPAVLIEASNEDLQRLLAIGRRLHERDYTFWRRLRKLGATPGLLREANAILNPRRASAQRSTIGLSQPACTQRRRIHARARGRRSAPARRRVRAASRGPDDGPLGGGEPPHRGRLSTVGAG